MLFGHVESRAHRIDHMIRLRDLQDKTGGFNAFIPLVYQRENNFLGSSSSPQVQEILKTYAISRILLDNIPQSKPTGHLNINLASSPKSLEPMILMVRSKKSPSNPPQEHRVPTGWAMDDFGRNGVQKNSKGFIPLWKAGG